MPVVRVNKSYLDDEFPSRIAKGVAKIANSWDEIAAWMEVPAEVLKATVDEYNASCDRGYDELFNKDRRYLHAFRNPPFMP